MDADVTDRLATMVKKLCLEVSCFDLPSLLQSLQSLFFLSARKFTMQKLITHDAIDQGVLNRTFSSAAGGLSSWDAELTNTPEIVHLLLDRMEADYVNLNPKMRSAYKYQTLDLWLSSTL